MLGSRPSELTQEFIFTNRIRLQYWMVLQGRHDCRDRALPSNCECFSDLPWWPIENFYGTKLIISRLIESKAQTHDVNKKKNNQRCHDLLTWLLFQYIFNIKNNISVSTQIKLQLRDLHSVLFLLKLLESKHLRTINLKINFLQICLNSTIIKKAFV